MAAPEETAALLPCGEAPPGAQGRRAPLGRTALACLGLLAGAALGGAALRPLRPRGPGGPAAAPADGPGGRGRPLRARAGAAGDGAGPWLLLARAREAAAVAAGPRGPPRSCARYSCQDVFELAHACQCNSGCGKFDDCCADYRQTCRPNSTHGAKLRRRPTPPPQPLCQHERTNKSECGHPRILAHSSASAPAECMCPPPLIPHKNESCNDCLLPKKPQQMTFYMYRAMGKDTYPMQNVNMASLAGVLWYLHREVVASTPRKFHITRILRYSVTMKTTEDYYNKTPNQFGPFVAFDSGSARGRNDTWKKYGYVVGCQLVDPGLFNYVPRPSEQPSCFPPTAFPCRAPKWYSLPGPCPEEKQPEKTPACVQRWPGGRCPSAVVTGSHTCTYFAAPAGEILLDELEGIDDYRRWWLTKNATTGDETPNGNVEYDYHLDAGIGMDFWDGRHSKANCTRRMEALEELFQRKYPELPASLPEPPCN